MSCAIFKLALDAFTYQPMIDTYNKLAKPQWKDISVRAPSQTAQRLLDQDLPVSIGILLPKPDSMSENKSMSVYITL